LILNFSLPTQDLMLSRMKLREHPLLELCVVLADVSQRLGEQPLLRVGPNQIEPAEFRAQIPILGEQGLQPGFRRFVLAFELSYLRQKRRVNVLCTVANPFERVQTETQRRPQIPAILGAL